MNIFIVTSCIQTQYGNVKVEDRYNQTLKTFESIKNKVPDAIIVFIDSSSVPLSEEKKETIKSKVAMYLDYSGDETAQKINSGPNMHQNKSVGESYLLGKAIVHLMKFYDFNKTSGRIFKLGGRAYLEDTFDIKDYDNTHGKYVFKTRKESYRGEGIFFLETRLYSLCFSLVDDYLNVLQQNIQMFDKMFHGYPMDTEHAHFLTINKDKLLEFDKLNAGCIIAFGGTHISD